MQTILLLCLIVTGNESAADDFTDVQIREPYRSYLLADPLLMHVTGAKVVELSHGRKMVMAVASMVPASTSPRHRIEAERICRIKALAYLVAQRNPVQIVHTEEVKDRVVIRIQYGHEDAESVSDLRETIRTHVEGSTRGLPVVGRWLSRDRSTLYLAIGMIADRTGQPVFDSPWSQPASWSGKTPRSDSQ